MTATATTATALDLPKVGSVITARSWRTGTRDAEASRAIVLMHEVTSPVDGYVVVWFPHRGAPVAGRSVQGVFPNEVESVAEMAAMPATWVIKAERVARHTRRDGGFDIGFAGGVVLEESAKAHRRARAQARRATG